MLRAGMATIYEARWGVEFGGTVRENRYKKSEKIAQQKKTGMWRQKTRAFESPREYKTRISEAEASHGKEKTTKRSRIF